MRLPYFYQQMLSFLGVILILVNVSIFSFYRLAYNSALETYEDRLFLYAELIIESYDQQTDFSGEELLLKSQDVSFMIVDHHGRLLFPTNVLDSNQRIIPNHIQDLVNGQRYSEIIETNEELFASPDDMIVYVPFFEEETGNYEGFVAVTTPLSVIAQGIDILENHLLTATLISTIIAIILSAILSVYQVKRINRMKRATKEVAEGNYNIRLEHKNRDEIDALSRDFNKMILALSKTQKELEDQEELRATFMQDAAHEMRTPLTTINGLLEGLEHGVISEENQQRSIQLMSKETKRLIRLVNENLHYENLRSRNQKINKNLIPMSDVFEETSIQMKRLAEKENNKLVFHLDENEINIFADYDRLKQILVNLLKNAIQFTSHGTIEVNGLKTKYGTRITIKDDGIGMSDDEVKKIWERFYKADLSRANTTYGESGLGLSIVYQIVDQHGGLISVQTKKGKGTTFIIDFPDSKEQEELLHQEKTNDIIEDA